MVTLNATANLILDAAEIRMRQSGFNAVSIRDLADHVSVKSASVHYYFPTKEDLGVALVERYHARFFEQLQASTSDGVPAPQRLRAFTESYRRSLVTADAICLCAMLGAEGPGLPASVAAAVRGFFAANIDWLAKVLPANSKGGEPQQEAAVIVAGLHGAMILATSLGDIAVFDATVARLLRPYLA